MNKRNIYLGQTCLNSNQSKVEGTFVDINNEKFYKISQVDQMPDFFMSIVSDSDHWMFLSSNGSLSAGRKDRNNALFPYYTDDKIHDFHDLTGPKTVILVEKDDKTFLWEPFSKKQKGMYSVQRNLYKNTCGNKIIFEEINLDLGLSFTYSWSNSERFGFVRKSVITNKSHDNLIVEVLDGIQNILPYGIDYNFQNEYSNLLDGYKKNELLPESGLGLFMLSAIPVDRAEPSESLKTTTVWSYGLDEKRKVLVSAKQLENFKLGLPVETETDVRATRGAYFVNTTIELAKEASKAWYIVAEINQDNTAVANLNQFILSSDQIISQLNENIETGTSNLKKIVANADGLQMSHETLCSVRHFTNTMFNVMRGGIFTNNYTVDTADFKHYVSQINKLVNKQWGDWLNQLPTEIQYDDLLKQAEKTGNADLMRISYEYLPLTFSRRHGDPSRPWNVFSIETKNNDGSPKLNYQGNWRDIFQNWEALSLSYPEFIEGMISKFVNASTPDGYNPYRITREGIDWECPDPEDPWAYIGYWGDHQIIYLEKFLELSQKYHPAKLDELLHLDIFAYANVPYRIKPYSEMVKNPQDTIVFDANLNAAIKASVSQIGADARLLQTKNSEVYRVNLTEKILVTLLAKLSNFIPEAGIWLNTQRPEWNDANNALVGNGVSMVTLYYLRRFLNFWIGKFSHTSLEKVAISEEVKTLLDSIHKLFAENKALLESGFSNADRRRFADSLGEAASSYRDRIYNDSFSGAKSEVSVNDLLNFSNLCLAYMDQSIRANKRPDGLYHAYNLISFADDSVSIRYLYEMLEGQVAVLSSGYLSVTESLDVMNALKASKLFRPDQYSYILYPDRDLPRFEAKNNIPDERMKASSLLTKLIEDNNTSILSRDVTGVCHFNGTIRNADTLEKALNQLNADKYGHLLQQEKQLILDAFEEIFDHQSFTGRSGTFFAYEGLGSIYWHMVSKLLLAVQECYFDGVTQGANPATLGKIKDHYYEIKAGLGLYKSPDLYGAFPIDAYSHTPAHAGAKQPGMTGQVKEDVISRMGELGVHVDRGVISFKTSLMNPLEMLKEADTFEHTDISGQTQTIDLQPGQLAFTICQVPVVYEISDENKTLISYANGQETVLKGHAIGENISTPIFRRDGSITGIKVSFTKL
ncbi:hypothetical protein [Mangrovibacterium sp.]|uniref:hypothetical protein n=1 Tax=Mangrovibacterium sp. TaxID=1961364 RepID=UPI003561BD8E